MQKGTAIISLSVLLFVASSGLPSWSAPDPQKKIQAEKRKAQKQMQQQSGQGGLQSQEGRMDNQSADSGGAGESISMFKAGNTTLPSGTYAMTNVSTGAAFVVIIDDTGDMRAQDARAMNLFDDSKISKNSSKNYSKRNSNGSAYGNSNNNSNYNNNSNFNDSQNSDSGRYNSDRYNSDNSNSGQASPPLLTPQPTPASAVLPAPTGVHPLLQGQAQNAAYPPAQAGGGLPNLFTGQNTLSSGPAGSSLLPGMAQPKQGGIQGLFNQLNPSASGQPGGGGIQSKIQAEVKRQITKQLMKQGTGGIEQQVRKMIKF